MTIFILVSVFYYTNTNSLEKYKSLSLLDSVLTVYVMFYIKHHVALALIITAPRMRLVKST